MLMIHMPTTFKIGDTADVRINREPKRLTWRDPKTLVIEPDDARTIIEIIPDGQLVCFTCTDAGCDPGEYAIIRDDDGVNVSHRPYETGTEVRALPVAKWEWGFADVGGRAGLCVHVMGKRSTEELHLLFAWDDFARFVQDMKTPGEIVAKQSATQASDLLARALKKKRQ